MITPIFKKLFYAVAAAAGLSVAAGPMAAQDAGYVSPRIATSFNNQALVEIFSASCSAQAQRRAGQVKRVMLPHGTAPDFKDQGAAFVIESPRFTERHKRAAEALVASVPPQARALAFNEGGVFVLPLYGTAEAVPARRAHSGGYITPGLYLSPERRLYVAFMLAGNVRRGADGRFVGSDFYEAAFHRPRIMNHEKGHMVDDLLGNHSRTGRGRLTNRPDFRAAFTQDLARMQRTGDILNNPYYMPASMGGQHRTDLAVRREVFAELWTEASGYGWNRLSHYCPETYSVVSQIYSHLETIYKTHGTPCIYEKNGTATAPAFS